MVEYRPIAGFPGYRIGSDGSVWSRRVTGTNVCGHIILGETWKRLKTTRRPYGARYVVVCMRATPNGRMSCRYVHRLVLEAFVGPCPAGMQARHFPDRDTSNNRLANLSWATPKVNHADKKTHGTAYRATCSRGHLKEGDNLYVAPTGKRECRECRRIRWRNQKGRDE